MLIQVLKSKIHRAEVTAASLDYEGSLTIASDLMDKVGLVPYERVLCSNLANGHRFETYAIPGAPGSGSIILNGATAHRGKPGDRLTIMSFAGIEASQGLGWLPKVVVLGASNAIVTARGITDSDVASPAFGMEAPRVPGGWGHPRSDASAPRAEH